MRKVLFILFIVFLFSTLVAADVYIKEVEREESYYTGIIFHPAKESINELWIGDGVMSYITKRLTVIYNRNEKKIIIVSPRSKRYVETAVPLELSKVLTTGLMARMKTWKATGKVKKTSETKTLLKRKATAYDVHYWAFAGDKKLNETKGRVWATVDVKCDWKLINEMLGNLRKLYNRDAQLRKELAKIEGVQAMVEFTLYNKGVEMKFGHEVVEIEERTPPKGIYSAPKGYKKVEKFTSEKEFF